LIPYEAEEVKTVLSDSEKQTALRTPMLRWLPFTAGLSGSRDPRKSDAY